jgi:hypothetical protein
MIHFKDRTFCATSFRDGCGNKECARNFTPELNLQNAKEDLPIAVAEFKSETCGYVQRDDSTTP